MLPSSYLQVLSFLLEEIEGAGLRIVSPPFGLKGLCILKEQKGNRANEPRDGEGNHPGQTHADEQLPIYGLLAVNQAHPYYRTHLFFVG